MFRCLIIDDDKFERDGLRYMIDQLQLPLKVTDVRNGNMGIECLSRESYDLVITDIKMSVMDGITFLEKAREIQTNCVYIIYSGYSDFIYAKKAIKLQVLDFLVKPVSDEEFEKVMHRALLLVKEKHRISLQSGLKCLRDQKEPQELIEVHGRLLLLETADWENVQEFFQELGIPVIEWRKPYYLGYLEGEQLLSEGEWKAHQLKSGIFSRSVSTWSGMKRACERLQEIAVSCIFRETVTLLSEEDVENVPLFVRKDRGWEEAVCLYLEAQQVLPRNRLETMLAEIPKEQSGLVERILQAQSIEEIRELVIGYNNQDEVVYHIRQYIKKYYAKELSVDLLADAVALTPSYLCTLFKRQTGVTLIHYLTQYRIEKAIELLEENTYKTSEVARRVGYHNLSYFNLVFKERIGKTPGQYRKEKYYQRLE